MDENDMMRQVVEDLPGFAELAAIAKELGIPEELWYRSNWWPLDSTPAPLAGAIHLPSRQRLTGIEGVRIRFFGILYERPAGVEGPVLPLNTHLLREAIDRGAKSLDPELLDVPTLQVWHVEVYPRNDDFVGVMRWHPETGKIFNTKPWKNGTVDRGDFNKMLRVFEMLEHEYRRTEKRRKFSPKDVEQVIVNMLERKVGYSKITQRAVAALLEPDAKQDTREHLLREIVGQDWYAFKKSVIDRYTSDNSDM